jgi:hypothetical protein
MPGVMEAGMLKDDRSDASSSASRVGGRFWLLTLGSGFVVFLMACVAEFLRVRVDPVWGVAGAWLTLGCLLAVTGAGAAVFRDLDFQQRAGLSLSAALGAGVFAIVLAFLFLAPFSVSIGGQP